MSGEGTRIECFQIKKIPDLSLNKYQSLADTGIDGVLKRNENFIDYYTNVQYGKIHSTLFEFTCKYQIGIIA